MATAITGNTYPVKDQLKALGGKWDADRRAWMVPDAKAQEAQKLVASAPVSAPAQNGKKPFRHYKCKVCGQQPSRYNPIYRNGECKSCYTERKEDEGQF